MLGRVPPWVQPPKRPKDGQETWKKFVYKRLAVGSGWNLRRTSGITRTRARVPGFLDFVLVRKDWVSHLPDDGALLSPAVEVFRSGTNNGYAFQAERLVRCKRTYGKRVQTAPQRLARID